MPSRSIGCWPHRALARRVAGAVAGLDEGEDVVQTAVARAYRALAGFHRGRPFRPWLLQIVVNEARTARCRAQRRAATVEQASRDPRLRRWAESSEATIMRAEAESRLHCAVCSLPRPHYEVVVCGFVLELTEAETSLALGVPPGTVKSRLSRALERLRNELDRDLFAESA
jgi:RNA polymerase sigma-70 factor (ECF subfamily)